MEKALNNGGLRLPIGYRFKPTDEELVVHYLKRKVFSLPLPASIIPDFDFDFDFDFDPYALPGDANEKRYFFYKKNKSHNQRRNWKAVGKGRLIVASHLPNQPVVGLRTTFAFRHGNKNHSRWLLHEYHLLRSGPTPNSLHLICPMGMDEYWVVCGLFQKKRRKKTKQRVLNKNNSGPTTPTIMSTSSQELTSLINASFSSHNSCTR